MKDLLILLLISIVYCSKEVPVLSSYEIEWLFYKNNPEKSFYLNEEIDKDFKIFNISFNVELIWINQIQKLDYSEVYYDQIIPDEITVYQQTHEFKANLEFINNAFNNGIKRDHQELRDIRRFNYKDDNRDIFLKTVAIQQDLVGNEVDINFHLHKVNFNTKLNYMFNQVYQQANLQDSQEYYNRKLEYALLKDYIYSHRDYAFYLIDCTDYTCDEKLSEFLQKFNKKYGDKIFVDMIDLRNTSHRREIDKLQNQIEGMINDYFTKVQFNETNMFELSLKTFMTFITSELFPRINQFKFESSIYGFDSPLNFIMVSSDFKSYLENFHQLKSLMKLAYKFQRDSLFTIQETEDQTSAAKKKQETAAKMIKSIDLYTQKYLALLLEYHHLIQHDQKDCGKEMTFSCFLRRYGSTIISMIVFCLISVYYLNKKLNHALKGSNKKHI